MRRSRRDSHFFQMLATSLAYQQRLRPIEARDALMRLVDGVSGILFSEALAAEGGGVRQGVQARP